MDDKRLQSEFDGYFKGANLPENMTADAKAQVKPRRRDIRKWFLRLAPVAAAFVFIVVASVMFINRISPSGGDTGNAGNSVDNTPNYRYYTAAGLTEKYVDPFTDKIKGLEFAKELAFAPNSDINLTAFYENENIMLAKAEISLLHNGYRHDTVLYVEYTDEYYCCEELKDYLTGDERNYRGYNYIYNLDYDEGENVYMIYMYTRGVKYYLSVMTSEPNGYGIYFDFLKNI